MATGNSFDLNKAFGELNSPLFTGNPTPTTPAQRKAMAQANLGFQSGIASAHFSNQPVIDTTVTAVDATATMTAASLLGGIITSTSAAAVAATVPLGSAIETAIATYTPVVGTTFDFSVVNTGPNTWTLTANTGVTIVGAAAVATATSATFRVRRTGANTYVVYRV